MHCIVYHLAFNQKSITDCVKTLDYDGSTTGGTNLLQVLTLLNVFSSFVGVGGCIEQKHRHST